MPATEEVVRLAAGLALRQLASRYRAAVKRRVIGTAVCAFLAFIVLLSALACAVGACWLWLAPQLGQVQAALVCMGVLLVVAIILALAARHFAGARVRRSPPAAVDDLVANAELSGFLEKHMVELLIAAAVTGLVLGLRKRK
jgi:FtsH-binding integral membrane protein